MAFSSVPKESKKQINKAGNILINANSKPDEIEWALALVNKWRS